MARLPLSRALFAALCSRSTSLSVQCHCLSLLRCVTLTCHRPQHWLEWVFVQYIWERSATLAQHGSESLKTDPLKFFRRFFQLVVAVMVVVIRRAPWSGIAFTYMHMRIVETPLPFAYRIHSHRGILPRGPSYFYHMVFHHRCAFRTDIAETSYCDSCFCPWRR